MNKKLIKELRQLYTGELASAIGFIAVWLIYIITQKQTHIITLNPAFIVCLVNISLILLTGSYFWKIMLEQIQKNAKHTLTAKQYRRFKILKRLSTILIIIATPLYLHSLTTQVKLMTTIAYVFMWLEYINYFFVRLSYLSPREFRALLTHKRLKQSQLKRAMHDWEHNNL